MLTAIRLLHTVVWAFFVACIAGIFAATWAGRLGLATLLIAVVMVEVAVLVANAWRCPLTAMAARHTEQRQANFDIFLPLWLARHNQAVFGTLYLLAILYTLWSWFVEAA